MNKPITTESKGEAQISTWAPILLVGEAMTAEVWDAVNAIADAIQKRTYVSLSQKRTREYRSYEEPLLYGYLSLTTGDEKWRDIATEHLNAAIDQASMLKNYPGLYGGLCGLGWVVEHLSQVVDWSAKPCEEIESSESSIETDAEEDLNSEIDHAVIAGLRSPHWRSRSYDLIGGLVGIGVYFLERLPQEPATQGVSLVLDHLEALAEHTDVGARWHSAPELLPEWQRESCPGGYYNMGVAHGIPGILFLLSEMVAARIERERAFRLLESAMAWFLAQKRPSSSRSWFSSWISSPGESSDSRLAWCYGDLGIAAVLTQIARRTQNEEWQEFANQLLEHCLDWPKETSGVVDAPLCHGAIGNAHVFNRIYQLSGDSRCRQAALDWLGYGLAMRQPQGGVGGFFQITRPNPLAAPVWEASPAFLDGAVGLALGLMAATTSIEPQWDRLLLLSGRPWPVSAK